MLELLVKKSKDKAVYKNYELEGIVNVTKYVNGMLSHEEDKASEATKRRLYQSKDIDDKILR